MCKCCEQRDKRLHGLKDTLGKIWQRTEFYLNFQPLAYISVKRKLSCSHISVLSHVFTGQCDGVFCYNSLPSWSVSSNKHALIVLQTQNSLFLKRVQLELPLQAKGEQRNNYGLSYCVSRTVTLHTECFPTYMQTKTLDPHYTKISSINVRKYSIVACECLCSPCTTSFSLSLVLIMHCNNKTIWS